MVRPGGRVVASLFAAPERSQSTVVHHAMQALIQPADAAEHAPYALSAPGNLEAALEAAGLHVTGDGEVGCSWRYASRDDAIHGLLCSAGGARAKEAAGEDTVRRTLAEALAPFERGDGIVNNTDNTFRRVAASLVIHHVGYVVEDLQRGRPSASRATSAPGRSSVDGAHRLRRGDATRARPRSTTTRRRSAPWGPILVEVTAGPRRAAAPGWRAALTPPGGGIGHVGLARRRPRGGDARGSEAAGPASRSTPAGPGRCRPPGSTGGDLFGHPVEVLQRSAPLLGFYSMLREAADEWDGNDPFRHP